MDLLQVFNRFPNQEACITHLETIPWGDKPACPYCGSVKVARRVENQRVGRWNCHGCKPSFKVLSGTIFSRTKIPLQKWFLGIALVVNAKKILSTSKTAVIGAVERGGEVKAMVADDLTGRGVL